MKTNALVIILTILGVATAPALARGDAHSNHDAGRPIHLPDGSFRYAYGVAMPTILVGAGDSCDIELEAGESIRRALFAAVHVGRKTESLRTPHLAVAAFWLAAASVPALLSLFAKNVLGASAAGYGMMLGAIGVGAVTGAVLLKRWRSTMHPRAVIGGALFLTACGLLAFGIGLLLRHTAGAISTVSEPTKTWSPNQVREGM